MTHELPALVKRYFDYALPAQWPVINEARLRQTGTLRTDLKSETWRHFTAQQLFHKGSFEWQAQVAWLGPLNLHITDSYAQGIGAGSIRLFSWLTLAAERDKPALNEAELHRYLAEGVWCPTNLLPTAGVRWRSIDEQRAIASLEDLGVQVELEFTFAPNGAVQEIYTPARFGRFGKEYRASPWRGRFADYREVQGLRIPFFGEVGWRVADTWEWVWRGDIADASYDFA